MCKRVRPWKSAAMSISDVSKSKGAGVSGVMFPGGEHGGSAPQIFMV